MQAIEFIAEVTNGTHIQVPSNYLKMFENHQAVRVIVLVDDDDEIAWRVATAQQFFNGYAEEDSVYDNL